MPKRILLVHPNRESVRAHGLPHAGLASLAAVLRNNGHNVLVIDYLLSPNAPSITHFLKDFSPDIVGISAYTAMISKAFRFIDSIYNYNREIPIIVGGPHATLYPEDFLRDGRVSYIFKGESEERIGEIINSAIQENSPKVIDCQPIDIKKLPFPDFRCFYNFEKIQDYPLVTTRGCPYECSFCMVKFISSRRYRCKEISTCCNEIMNAQTALPQLKAVSVIDDNCSVLKYHFHNFLLAYIERIDLPLGFAYIRADAINDEVLTLIKRAGTKSVCIAIEHGHPEVYKHINKGEKLDDIIQAAYLVRKRGFGLELCFIIGLPYDTFEMTKYNIKLAKHLKASRIYWNMLVPYKGTQAREWFLKNGTLFGEADRTSHVDYSCFCDEPAMETKEMTAEDRKKAYFYAMLETNNYVLRAQDVLKDIPRLFIAAYKYGLYKTLIKNLIFQCMNLPLRLKGRILKLISKGQS